MTKQEFNERYPEGLKNTIVLFERAFHKIMTTDEIDKCIKCAPRSERKTLKKLKEAYLEVVKDKPECDGLDTVPWILTLTAARSSELLKDVISYMVSLDELPTYKGEDLE